MESQPPAAERVRAYHARTKHHLHRYAASLGYLDWSTQPDPWRTYAGAPLTALPLAEGRPATCAQIHRPGTIEPAPLDLASLGAFFELALGLSAWKEYAGERWALRCNPSSGNLHPTEGYAVIGGVPGLAPGVHHYVSRDHALEGRRLLTGPLASLLANALPHGAFLAGLASIHWREAWKYGERGYRYCQHDAGHALACLRYAAAVLGWTARLLLGPSDGDVAALLGLGPEAGAGPAPEDAEHPDALVLVLPADEGADRAAGRLEERLGEIAAAREPAFAGRANALSPAYLRWDAIEGAAQAAAKPSTRETRWEPESGVPAAEAAGDRDGVPAAEVIRGRRSAVAFDGRTALEASAFFRMLDRLRPRRGVPPWDALGWEPAVHPVLFVHRVRGLDPGLYALPRARRAEEELRATLGTGLAWERVPSAPDDLPLRLLASGDMREAARLASCHQEIAADGSFALAMLASFEGALHEGAWWYRRLHWEAGMLGQVLYFEAEAAGVRGTGIGCYFDDVVHEWLGLRGEAFQDLYHFTVGGPVEDLRLTTRPAYPTR